MSCLSTTHIYSTTITSTSIAVTWEPVPLVATYQVEYQEAPVYPDTPGTWTQLVVQNTLGANIGNLTPDTEYLIRVNTICRVGGSCYSVTIKASTNP